LEDYYLRAEEPFFWVGTSNLSMGRGGRVYEEADRKEKIMEKGLTALRLHDGVPKKLHQLGFGSVYLYEAILCCPIPCEAWKNHRRILRYVYADALRSIRKGLYRGEDNKEDVEQYVLEQINENRFSRMGIKIIIHAFSLLPLYQFIKQLPARFVAKIFRRKTGVSLMSDDRGRYNTIMAAFNEVKNLSQQA
jgi:hypothetical protein